MQILTLRSQKLPISYSHSILIQSRTILSIPYFNSHYPIYPLFQLNHSLRITPFLTYLFLSLNTPQTPVTSRCLGADFLPFLPMVITKLLAAISQEVSFQTGEVDLEELEQR